MNCLKIRIFSIFLITAIYVSGQDVPMRVRAVIINHDTIPYIEMTPFVYFGKLTPEERHEKLVLTNRIKVVLPYAKMAAFRLQLMEQNLKLIKNKKERKKYIIETEKQLKNEFTDQLKNLSINQGKLLVKLIHRETGNSVYELLNNYSGRAETFFWNSFAKFWGSDLDATYDAVEDYKIEQIIRSLDIE